MYVYFERYFAIRKAAAESPDFMNRIKDYISAGQLPSAQNLCAEKRHAYGKDDGKGYS